MKDDNAREFPYLLTICDGSMHGATAESDDLVGAVALAEMAHTRGYACWLWDTDTDTPVACSTAACFGCEREHECGEVLDLLDRDGSAAFFVAFLRDEGYPPSEIRMVD